nr:DUF1684 domain-containing protein [Deinobacterium chartae]
MLDFRRRKDAHFASAQGPLEAAQRSAFSGLRYFAPDEAYRVRAAVVPAGSVEEIELATTSGEARLFVRLGYAEFELPTGRAQLDLFAPAGDPEPQRAFVPFRDATSGRETYGTGRYLDAPLEGGEVLLDFNLAYNPYCAYQEGWSCPLPPRQNWLSLEVRAGELDFVG